MSAVLVVCPSVTEADATRFCAEAQTAMEKGGDLRAVLVANSAGTQVLAEEWPDLVVSGDNAGFAASINQGVAAGGDFRWLVVANDDMNFDAETFGRLTKYLADEPAEGHRLIRLTLELPWRRIPGVAGVFANLSLLENVFYALGRRYLTETDEPSDPSLYPPFTLVAITADLWHDVAGLNEALPFCFEDAWFVRRARASAGGLKLGTRDLGVHHQRSVSTGTHIDLVLPVISWSAVVYLGLIGVPRVVARTVCVAALVLRMPLSLLSRADRRKHLRGIRRSLTAILTGRQPSLPQPGGAATS